MLVLNLVPGCVLEAEGMMMHKVTVLLELTLSWGS